MKKPAETSFPVHTLIRERWSPRAFADRSIEAAAVGSLLEAARWAPSCFNDQPWAFLVARREDRTGFERLGACLVEANGWARSAGLLLLAAVRPTFARNGKPNRHAAHDVGLALENLFLQAEALGLGAHAMAGFDPTKARESLAIPLGWEPLTMVAVGHPALERDLPADQAERERAPRTRRPLREIAFGARWEAPLDEVG
jgi:nitroreductase